MGRSMGRLRHLGVVIAVALASASFAVVAANPAGATTTQVTVGQGNVSLFPSPTTDWVSNDDNTNAPGDVSFVAGPATPPAGNGSARIGVANSPTAASDLVYLNTANASTKFSQITSLQYSTYRSSVDAGNNLAVTLQFNVDYDTTDANTNWQGRVVFEPYFTAGSGNVVQNTWQTWSPLAGKWWMTGNPIVGNTTGTKACPQSSPCTWSQLLVAYPNSGFNPGQPFVNLKGGSAGSWPGFVGNVDALTLGVGGNNTVFDFEPTCTTDCYVATTGNDNATGTMNDPFLTVQKGLNSVSSGGVVHVADGIYNTATTTTINKPVTLQGESRTGTILNGPRAQVDPAGALAGLQITGTTSNVTIQTMSVQHYDYGVFTNGNVMSNITIQHLNADDNRLHGIWIQASVGSGINGLTVTDVDASRNNQLGGSSGRGLWVINGPKSNVTVTNSTFADNGLVGLDMSDGSITGATITGNTVTGSGDSGIALLGGIAGGANLVTNNTVTNNGRYGIEIKNSTGDGTDSGNSSLTVKNNVVTRTLAATDARDYGGIVVIRRSPLAPSPDQPAGVVVENNTVSGYHRKAVGSTGDGFGIVVGGVNHVITKNTVSNNDVGIQVQAGNTPDVQNTIFFDRDSAAAGSASVTRNSITGNGVGFRTAGTVGVAPTCNWWGAANGPGAPGGTGSGDPISAGVTFSPWLTSSNLDGPCGPVTVSVGPASIAEGNGTNPVVNVPVTLSAPYGGTVTVNYATQDGTGVAGATAPNDYTATSGTVTFLPGVTAHTVPVTIQGSAAVQLDEYNETFRVVLSSPTNATIATGTGTVTIVNDDTPSISLPAAPVTTIEGNSGTHTVQVPVTLSNPSVAAVSVHYATVNGSATSPSDYIPTSGTLTFAPGETSKFVTVTVKGDTSLEDTQYFTVVLSAPAGSATATPLLGVSSQSVQILNDEKPLLTAKPASVNEGQTAVFQVTLKQRYYQAIDVAYTTVGGSATDGVDYTHTSGILHLPAGMSGTVTVSVPTNYDFTAESAEKFTVTFSSASLKTSPVVATGTIRKNKT